MQQRGQRATASAAWPNKPRKNLTLFSCHQEFYPFFFTSGLSKCIRKLTENSVARLVTLRQAHPVHDFDFYAFYTHYRGRGSFQLRTGVMISFAPWLLLPFHRCRCCCPYLFGQGYFVCLLPTPHTLSHIHTHRRYFCTGWCTCLIIAACTDPTWALFSHSWLRYRMYIEFYI